MSDERFYPEWQALRAERDALRAAVDAVRALCNEAALQQDCVSLDDLRAALGAAAGVPKPQRESESKSARQNARELLELLADGGRAISSDHRARARDMLDRWEPLAAVGIPEPTTPALESGQMHETKVEKLAMDGGPTSYVASCTCGWEDGEFIKRQYADAEAYEHRRSAAAGPVGVAPQTEKRVE